MVEKKTRSYLPLFCAIAGAVFFAAVPFFSQGPVTPADWGFFVCAGLCGWAAWRLGRGAR